MNAPGTFDFYAAILIVHILAAVAAFGVTFAHPIIDAVIRRLDPRSLPTYHELQIQISRRVVTPPAIVVLIAGIYLVADRWKHAGSGWYSAAGAIIVVILGIEHALLIPNARKLRDRAALDVQSSGDGTVALGSEYEQLAGQRRLFTGIVSLLVLVAVVLMVVKPGA